MASATTDSGLVTIFGGSGFVGRHTVRELASRGWRVRAAVRRPDLAGHLQPMGAVGQIHAVQANLRYPQSVAQAVQGADVVVNLVAVLSSTGRQTFDALHVDGARAAARAAKAAGVRRFVHVSSIGADPAAPSRYSQTKAAGERAVLEEFPEAVIVRPSIVFGPEDQFFNRFAAMASISPLLPLIGGGTTKFQPVYVADLAKAITSAVEGRAVPGTIYEIGGPEVLTFRELLQRMLAYIDRTRGFLKMPFWLAKVQAALTAPLPNSLRPITVDQVRSLERDNVVSELARTEGRTIEALGVSKPHSIEAVVPEYLIRFRPRGQYAAYRG